MESGLRDRLLNCLDCCSGNAEKFHTALKFIIDRGMLEHFVNHMERALDPGYYENLHKDVDFSLLDGYATEEYAEIDEQLKKTEEREILQALCTEEGKLLHEVMLDDDQFWKDLQQMA